MSDRRSRWVEAVALLHLIPGAMALLVVSFILWLAVPSTWAAAETELKGLLTLALLLFGASVILSTVLALPFFFLGLGLLRRRAWARFVALYMAFGLAGTGLVFLLAQRSGWGALPLLHAAATLGVLLLPRFAREFDPQTVTETATLIR